MEKKGKQHLFIFYLFIYLCTNSVDCSFDAFSAAVLPIGDRQHRPSTGGRSGSRDQRRSAAVDGFAAQRRSSAESRTLLFSAFATTRAT